MYENLDCIALRTVRYSDRHNIFTAYSRQRGKVVMTLPAGGGKAAMRVRALTQPLSVFQCVADVRPGREIMQVRDLRHAGARPLEGPVRSTLGLFMADMLASLLREPQCDELLFDYIVHMAAQIAGASGVALANIHICFLMRLQHFMGIEPDWSTYAPGAIFDMADGIFRSSPPLHGNWLPSGEAEAAWKLRRMNARTAALFAMGRRDRNLILDRLIQYYQIHFPGLASISSLDILRAIFD